MITGGCGYIGAGLIRKLLKKGYLVKCLDLMIYGDKAVKNLSNHEKFTLIKGDIRDKKLDDCTKDIDEIVHLAAIVGDKPCEVAPMVAHDINHNGTNFGVRWLKKMELKNLYLHLHVQTMVLVLMMNLQKKILHLILFLVCRVCKSTVTELFKRYC